MPRNPALSEDSDWRHSPAAGPPDEVALLDDESPGRDPSPEAAEEESKRDAACPRSILNSPFVQSFGSVLASMAFHVAVLIVLAFTVLEPPVKNTLRPIVANLVEEQVDEFVEVELDRQIEAATEQAAAVLSTPLTGALGTGPAVAGAVQVDPQVVEHAERVEMADAAILGIDALRPPTQRIVEEVPAGFLGDPRAIVDDYQEAMDRITQEILLNLQQGPVLVVWCFDQSESMKDDQREIRDRVYRVYEELGLVNATHGDLLTTAVVSYGEGFLPHTRRPTHEPSEIKKAIEQVPIDPSGKEFMCSAIGKAINLHREYCQRTRRRMLLILVTDESGEPSDNDQNLEAVIALAKASQCKVYTLGREAVFGYPHAYMRWKHPQTERVHWLRIDRGPETAFVEQLQIDGYRRRHDAFPSGFGPYEQARLSRETGGVFFMLPSVETNIVRGAKSRYELEIMRPYRPDLRSRAECFFDRDKSRLQTTCWDIIYTFNPYNPQAARHIELRVEFSRDVPTLVRQAQQELTKAPPLLAALAKASETVEKLHDERAQETNPRWQANYDLLRAHLVGYQARVYEYAAYLRSYVKDPQTAPLTKSPNLVLDDWHLTTRKETLTEESRPYIERSLALYETVIQNHPGTPWAGVAQKEIARGFGVKLVPDYQPAIPKLKEPLKPVPKF